MLPYPVPGNEAEPSKCLKKQATYLDSTSPLVQELNGLRKANNVPKVRIGSNGFSDDEDQTLNPLAEIKEDVP